MDRSINFYCEVEVVFIVGDVNLSGGGVVVLFELCIGNESVGGLDFPNYLAVFARFDLTVESRSGLDRIYLSVEASVSREAVGEQGISGGGDSVDLVFVGLVNSYNEAVLRNLDRFFCFADCCIGITNIREGFVVVFSNDNRKIFGLFCKVLKSLTKVIGKYANVACNENFVELGELERCSVIGLKNVGSSCTVTGSNLPGYVSGGPVDFAYNVFAFGGFAFGGFAFGGFAFGGFAFGGSGFRAFCVCYRGFCFGAFCCCRGFSFALFNGRGSAECRAAFVFSAAASNEGNRKEACENDCENFLHNRYNSLL